MNFKLLTEAREAIKRQDAEATDSLLDALIDGFDPDTMPDDLAARFYSLLDEEPVEVSEDAVDRVMAMVLGEETPGRGQLPSLWQCVKHGLDAQGISTEVAASLENLACPMEHPPQNWRELSRLLNESGIHVSEPVARQIHRAAVRGWGLVAPKSQTPARSFEAARRDLHRA